MGAWTSYRARAATTAGLVVLVLALALGVAAGAQAQTVELAAPYEYLGWGSPQPPAEVLAASGLHDITLAFVLSHGKCNPQWDGRRPLLGGPDQAAIAAIRGAGGDVDVSFGGWSGKKLGSVCKTPQALTGAYQTVIDAYSLHAIDIDIEHGEFTNKKTRARVVAALAAVQSANPALEISVTFGTGESGPEGAGQSLIADAAAIGFAPSAWTIMPFDFGAPVANMGQTSIAAAEGLARELSSRYGVSLAAAYQHVGISSMNGRTDESDETVGVGDFQAMLSFASEHHLARLSFWSVNRDRPCPAGGREEDACSGIAQQPWQFSDLLAQYHG
jgi:chitinase